jgi:CRP-like cAMP-binding protein
MAINKDGSRSEVGCVGREGLCGIPVLLGAESSPHYAFVQVGGSALRIRSSALQSAMEAHPSLRRRLLRYVHVFMLQVAATDLADSRYGLEQRLARWLLMCQDRVEHDEMPLTHEMLSSMIGSRRSGVTVTLHKFEGERIIKAERGWITVLNRQRLLEVAGDSYGVPELEYQRLLSEC